MQRFFSVLIQPEDSNGRRRQIPSSLGHIDLDEFQKRLEDMNVRVYCNEDTESFTLLDTQSDG